MNVSPAVLPVLIAKVDQALTEHQDEIIELDMAIGDGDHLTNLQRGVKALLDLELDWAVMNWSAALQKIGMTLLSTMGGASGSLLGSFFLAMAKGTSDDAELNRAEMARLFALGTEAVKKRGKAGAGEKTMLDVLIPVADYLNAIDNRPAGEPEDKQKISQIAEQGMQSTRDMIATKGRASFLGEKSLGHIDAGARTCQLIICTLVQSC
jgi:dihydroxyacetone kinase-like protein